MRRNVIRSEFDGNSQGRTSNEVEGTAGDDRIVGTEFADILFGGGGNDRILTKGGGSDIVRTGAGNDVIVLEGDQGAFIIASDFEPGSDLFNLRKAGITRDQVEIVETVPIEVDRANSGLGGLGGLEIQIDGGETIALPQFSSADQIDLDRDFRFAEDNDAVAADDAVDDVVVEEEEIVEVEEEANGNDRGNNNNNGNQGNGNLNVVEGQGRNSNVDGTGGDDLLVGQTSELVGGFREVLTGGAGDDVLQGNGGFDLLRGGEGADRFVVSTDETVLTSIGDFDENDVIDFRGTGVTSFDQLQFTEGAVVNDLFIEADGAQTIQISGNFEDPDAAVFPEEDDFIFDDAAVAVG